MGKKTKLGERVGALTALIKERIILILAKHLK